jgi:Xaa-Pro aminopeptidase
MINLGLFNENDLAHQNHNNPYASSILCMALAISLASTSTTGFTRRMYLLPGMVLTFEPGIYIPEESIGIRLENTFVIGYPSYNLMENIPIDPDEIEH